MPLVACFLVSVCGAQVDSISGTTGDTGSGSVCASSEAGTTNPPVGRRVVIPWRLAVVGGAALGTLGATYWYLEKTWWSEKPTAFHFDDGADLHYAHNLDKLAHFYGGSIAGDLFSGGLRWAGMRRKAAAWYGFGLGVFVQLVIELKDGYAPRWGYSVWDVACGTAGALFFVGKHYSP
ncbi:MAG: DUF2279 domain-containing protein, partial [Bacteroidota bacterium]|nr:DUF2279 domain-containing protein [Bacteroidota bacterium]